MTRSVNGDTSGHSLPLAQAQEGAAGPGDGAQGGGGDGSGKTEDVVDAEFTEVDDDKKNKKSA